ncbi:hypothetical protein [Azohydromonas lata]|uniref:Uncharacterized protein n=1 Tax=Azohydromonas lata TaxID=45677 RepID=A0ABU5IEB4_9BURK|nr:hypothetical protein [Azohydromonas lata]MDZ5457005.1 hypothetical protein [Azohydromonas lata]
MKLSPQVRNNMAEAYELACNGQTVLAGAISGVAAPPRLRLRSGAQPADTTSARTGTVLVDMALPADWMANVAAGVKVLAGTWSGAGAAAAGAGINAGHYEIVSNDGATVHEQGTVTVAGGGGEIELVNINIAANQPVQITSKTITMPNG